jgi:Zn-dependent metalloprotease
MILLCASAAVAQGVVQDQVTAFAAKTGAVPTVSKITNSISFLRFPAARPYSVSGENVQQKSLNFLNENAGLFAIRKNLDAFSPKEEIADNYGLRHVTVQQTYNGVPVYSGVLKFHYNKDANISSLNGNFIPGIKVSTVADISQERAGQIAVKLVTGQKLNLLSQPSKAGSPPLKIAKNALWIFQKGLAQGTPQGAKYLVYEVEVRNDANVREFVFVDAHSGAIIEQFTGIHELDRVLHEGSINSTPIWVETDLTTSAKFNALDKWQKSEIETAGQISNLMKNAFGRLSYNGGANTTMITVNNDPGINCPNANWNGVSANYCTDIAADDVVAHEWGHAYTEYTSGLIYAWQSGAINEAYSDIWGETVDQLNNYFDAGETNTPNTGCGTTARWQLGEGTTIGALRDMWDPNCKGNPGRVQDPLFWCSSDDNGGVHINSGVVNHTYALLVDGGTYNNQTITGINFTKAAHIFWRAQSMYLTNTSNFASLADALEQACQDLIGLGTNLEGLSTTETPAGPSGQIMTANDAAQLAKVILATELRKENFCGFMPILKPVTALCEGANPNLALFSENFEAGLGAFIATEVTSSGNWVTRHWVQSNAPGGRSGKVAYAIDYAGDNCVTNQTGILRLESPLINIPVGTPGNLNMAFDHYIAIEEAYDGGNIKYSLNGGAWTILPQSAFTANGYNAVLASANAQNTNPLRGTPAFTGTDGGTIFGSWGQSQIDLTSIGLAAGGNIKFRWELGTDGCGGIDGWYIDDIKVFTCAITPTVHFALETDHINEGLATTPGVGCLPYIDKIVTVQIDKAPTQPVTVTLKTPTGTAKSGATADYTISPASVTLQSGNLSQNFTVRIYNDAYVEGSETIILAYDLNANGGNGHAAPAFQTQTITIDDDDLTPGNYTDVLLSSGFNTGPGGWIIKNEGNSFDSWKLANYNNAALDPDGRPFLFANSDAAGSGILMDESAESPVLNTSGRKNMVLTFAQDFNPYNGGYAETGNVDIWDGTTWQTVLSQTQTIPRRGSIFGTADIQTINIPDAYANANMKIRFHYQALWDNWWAIDNVVLTSSNSTGIQSAVNTGTAAQQYLGPNETAVFYDPASGNLIAQIKNLTNHDYGCTTVEIDRAGNNETTWFGNYKITNKTVKVTPTNNNTAGEYEITLYYKSTELGTFTGNSIKSMGKSTGGIGAGNVATSSWAEVQVKEAFSTDLAYTAKFKSGFSGFGLSDAPPQGALPVTLLSFTGKHSAEGNLLSWATTSEVNNDYFVVEHSTNARTFDALGTVSGIGNSKVTNSYKFLDNKFSKGVNYYRLKQVDKDGTTSYSKMISVDALNEKALKFFPNPVLSVLSMELPDLTSETLNLRIINTAGQEIIRKDKIQTRNGVLTYDVSKLSTGIYQVVLSGANSSYNFSVIKQ